MINALRHEKTYFNDHKKLINHLTKMIDNPTTMTARQISHDAEVANIAIKRWNDKGESLTLSSIINWAQWEMGNRGDTAILDLTSHLDSLLFLRYSLRYHMLFPMANVTFDFSDSKIHNASDDMSRKHVIDFTKMVFSSVVARELELPVHDIHDLLKNFRGNHIDSLELTPHLYEIYVKNSHLGSEYSFKDYWKNEHINESVFPELVRQAMRKASEALN